MEAPISAYAGLFLSCKLINKEYPEEALRTMNAFIDQVEQELHANNREVSIVRPHCFHNKNLGGIGRLVFSYSPLNFRNDSAILETLDPLISCHFDRLGIKAIDYDNSYSIAALELDGWIQRHVSTMTKGAHTIMCFYLERASGRDGEELTRQAQSRELESVLGRLHRRS